MPRAKRPLAEADPNASRPASNPKSARTNAGRVKKTAAGLTMEGDELEGPVTRIRNSTRKKSSDPLVRSRHPKSPPEHHTTRPSTSKSANNHTPRTILGPSTTPEYIHNGTTNQAREERGNRVCSGYAEEDRKIQSMEERGVDYNTKDNSKLRVLLFDRRLSTYGTREELIARLESSSVDYETYSSEQLTEMLRRRHIKNAAQGPKPVKVQRLQLNDAVDRDTANFEDTTLHVRTDLSGEHLDRLVAKQKAILAGEDQSYSTSTWTLAKLRALLEDRKLSCSGKKEALIARLRSNDRRKLANDISKTRKEYLSLKRQLEVQVGHPVENNKSFEEDNGFTAVDNQIQTQARMSRPGIPFCDYNWRESHWASRTERQLNEICSRREMPGSGPKAAMIKWLDTGSVEYDDLYVGSLERICAERGIKYRSGEKKVELVRLLEESDEQESAS